MIHPLLQTVILIIYTSTFCFAISGTFSYGSERSAFASPNNALPAPIVEDVAVPEITSAEIIDLPSAISEADSQREKNDYSSLSSDDLRIDVPMESVVTSDKYLITQPPSACDLTSGPGRALLDCTTTVAPIQVGFARVMPTSDE